MLKKIIKNNNDVKDETLLFEYYIGWCEENIIDKKLEQNKMKQFVRIYTELKKF